MDHIITNYFLWNAQWKGFTDELGFTAISTGLTLTNLFFPPLIAHYASIFFLA
jgi:hypothetical protein